MAGLGGIFISYRREDTADATGRLADLLVDRFGSARVFMDVNNIEPGQDFIRRINTAIAACDVLLVPIGSKWLAVDKNGQPRICGPDDLVSLEIRAALERRIVVIPILIDGAAMVGSTRLPEGLKDLARRHAVLLRHASFAADAERIIQLLDRVLATAELRREDRRSQLNPSPSPDDSSDPADEIWSLLVKRVKRRKRLWWGTYSLSILLATAPASIINPSDDGPFAIVSTMLVLATGLVWCVWKLQSEIANQRLLVDQLPVNAQVEPIRRALSRRHIIQMAMICLLVSLLFGVGMVVSPPDPGPETTGARALPALTARLDYGIR
ncbi:toll/interleukin-1 receptor domain-containing protein [Geodermatophilus africanus]|nr:toll/interleukin-1 receptor domain-containing protein [Geodermatophilus africanus]